VKTSNLASFYEVETWRDKKGWRGLDSSGSVNGFYGQGKEPSGSIICWKVPE
jgi:hypothetical protein